MTLLSVRASKPANPTGAVRASRPASPTCGVRAIVGLTAACILAFALTIPLPRVDGQLVGSDGVKYYAYLPSVLLDGDLDLTDEYTHLYARQPLTAEYLVADRTATGLPANRLGIGPALLWSPFFLAAHLLVLLLRVFGATLPADGYGWIYQATVLIGSIVYGGFGVWFCWCTARRVATERAALFATMLTVIAGNAIYYLTVEPSMSHALSLFASGAFFDAWTRARTVAGWRPGWRLGALAGLMALIRPQDGLFLALPIIDAAAAGWERARFQGLLRCLLPGVSMAAAGLVVFLPQLVVWKLLYGDFLVSGYRNEFDVLFHWRSPRLLSTLFSAHRGLLVWHPVFVLGLAGLWRLAASHRRLAMLSFAGFALQWYVVSSWYDWGQGDAFGGRMFIVCTPVFVIGLAALVDQIASRRQWRALLTAAGALILVNLVLLAQYRLGL